MKFGYMLVGTEGIVTTADYEASNKITGFESLADENLAMLEVSDAYSAFESVAYASDVEVECGMEADTTPDKNLKWYQKVWEWIKNIFKSLWGYIKTAYNWLKKKIFGDKSAVAQEKKVVEETAETVEEAYQEVVKQGLLTMKEKVAASAGGDNATPPSSGPTSTRTEQTTTNSTPASNVIVPEYKGPTVTAEPSVIIPEYKGEPVPEPVVEVVQKIVAKKQNLLALPKEIKHEVAIAAIVYNITTRNGNGEYTFDFFKFPENIISRFNVNDLKRIFEASKTESNDDTNKLRQGIKTVTDGYAAILYLLFGDKYGHLDKVTSNDSFGIEEILEGQKKLHKQTDFLLKKNKTFNLEKVSYNIIMKNGKIERSSLEAIYRELQSSLNFSNMVATLLEMLEKYISDLNDIIQKVDAQRVIKLDGADISVSNTEMKQLRISVINMGKISKAIVKCVGKNNLENIYRNLINLKYMRNSINDTEEVA